MSLPPDGTVLPLDAVLGRRDFCRTVVVGGAALVTLGGCGDGTPAAPLDGGKQDLAKGADDMATTADMSEAPADMAEDPGDLTDTRDMSRPPDMVDPNACPANAFKTGKAPASFAINTATLVVQKNLFICRDAGGLFALTAICTHAGCSVTTVNGGGGGFSCPCHGSAFTLAGGVTNGPAGAPLVHFALCLDGTGNVGVNDLQTVASNKRYSF